MAVESAEPTFLEAIARIKKELAGVGIVVAALGGGGSWFGLSEVESAQTKTTAVQAEAVAIAQFYAPELGRCRLRVEEQKVTCLELLENERQDTAHWRAQCGGP